MGFFSSIKSARIYNQKLSEYGINSNDLPSDVNSRICSYTYQHFERLGKMSPDMRDPIYLDAAFGNTARLMAYAILGKKLFKEVGGDIKAAKDMINHATRMWNETGGPEGSLESMIIYSLSGAKVLDKGFIKMINEKIN